MVAEVQQSDGEDERDETVVARSRGCWASLQQYKCMSFYYYLVGFGTGALSSISLGILHPLYDPNLSIRVLLWFRWGFRTHLVVATWNDSCFQRRRKATDNGSETNQKRINEVESEVTTHQSNIFILCLFFSSSFQYCPP